MPMNWALWWQVWQPLTPPAPPIVVWPAAVSVGAVMLAVPIMKPPGLTLAVEWQPEPLQSRVPIGMWLPGLVTMVTSPGNHIPIGTLDCSGSGCHSTANVNPGGFMIGTASITAPTLTAAGHTTIGGAGGVSGCQTCHEAAPYLGMLAGTNTTAGDSRPTTALDK